MRKLLPFLFLIATVAVAQSRDAVIDRTIATLLRMQTFEHVTISPDGSRTAYIKTVRDANGEKTNETGVYIGSARVMPPSRQPSEDSDPAWSPDSKELAYISDATGSQQLYVGGRRDHERQGSAVDAEVVIGRKVDRGIVHRERLA